MTNRKISEAGVRPLLGYLLALTAFVLLSVFMFQKTDLAKYLLVLTCLSIQFKLSEKSRSDFFLATFKDRVKYKIRIVENVIICIPFVSMLAYKMCFLEAGILFLCSILLAFITFQNTFNFTLPTPFSKRPFEFSTGFRKTFFLFPLAYILTLISINVDNINLGIFSFLFVFLISLFYYAKPEPDYYVWVHAESIKTFLKNKIITATKNATFLASPILIGLLVFYPADFETILIFFGIGILFLWAFILAKYSAYPGEIHLTEGIVFAFSIYFPPVLLVAIPFFYLRCLKQLKILSND